MIDAGRLLEDLTPLLRLLEDDMRGRCESQPEVDQPLRAEFAQAKQRSRTAQAYEEWRDDLITQSAVHWILGCVFVRFLEDNGLIAHPRDAAEAPYLSGPGPRRQVASDRRTVYFQKHPSETDREYLLDVFEQVAALPAGGALYDKAHNPLWRLGPTGDGAGALMGFWQRIEPSSGELVHDFTDPEWNTRFLGDLYQDLSEAARKKYALLQTPEFVEEFILNRTLTPAIEAFGWREVRLIDPTCGSGHFLLGAFKRLLDLWLKHEPATNPRELTQRALDAVCGVDLNPFAVAIARFRLLVAALRASGIERLKDAPGFRVQLATGDSLLHGRRWQIGTSSQAEVGVQRRLIGEDRLEHFYASEDKAGLDRLLGRQYHAVVGNPPYITVKDRALNEAYRDRYGSCHRQYSLAVPFMERFFELALGAQVERAGHTVVDEEGPAKGAVGFVGMITANSFMKREFGKKLIEEYIPRWDLTHVIDTSGAYIPGHGTPTVILFGRHQRPQGGTVRAVMGIRGEPTTPTDPARGLVWTSMLSQLDRPGSESAYVSVADVARTTFQKHPWSLGGGGASDLKELLEERSVRRLGEIVEAIGRTTVVGEDDAWIADMSWARRKGVSHRVLPLVIGECVRDWAIHEAPMVIYPYESLGGPPIPADDSVPTRVLWQFRAVLERRSVFGKTLPGMDRPWYEHLEHYTDKLHTPLSITFAFVATHNHFVLDRGGKVFKQSAPVIKLPKDATEDDHLALLGLLNSSTACFWMKQVLQPKSHASQRHHPDPARGVFEFAGTRLAEYPIPEAMYRVRIAALTIRLNRLAHERTSCLGLERGPDGRWQPPQWCRADGVRERMVGLQEELDWTVYAAYGLVAAEGLLCRDEDLDALTCPRGQRPFEQVHGRRSLIRAGGHVVPLEEAEAPAVGALPGDFGALWGRRRKALQENEHLSLVERLEYKRVWRDTEANQTETEYRVAHTSGLLADWLLDRLESSQYWPEAQLQSCARLSDRAAVDAEFLEVASLYRGREGYDLSVLVAELVGRAAVPFLPVLRYKEMGLRKRAIWERTWEFQRHEDSMRARVDPAEAGPDRPAADGVVDITVPPQFTAADFLRGEFWQLRGKLDVPRERFVSFPHCERDADKTLVVGWAGWDHLQQAQALAAYYVAMKETEGWSHERLIPLLAGLLELQPWLDQWHNAFDSTYATGMGDYFRGFVDNEARELGLTLDEIRAWKPQSRPRSSRRRKNG